MSEKLVDLLARVAGEHFVMLHALEEPGGPPHEWRCSCGLKFGFSDSAITHVASVQDAVVEAWLATRVQEAPPALPRHLLPHAEFGDDTKGQLAVERFPRPLTKVDSLSVALMSEWERVEGETIPLSRVATFADLARLAIDRLEKRAGASHENCVPVTAVEALADEWGRPRRDEDILMFSADAAIRLRSLLPGAAMGGES